MGKIVVFAVIILVIVIAVTYLFFKHEINDLLHRGEVSDRKKELEFSIKRKQRERDMLGSSVGDEYARQRINEEIKEYEQLIESIKQGKEE